MNRKIGNCIINDDFKAIEYKAYKVYLKGLLFIDGYKAGAESIGIMLDEFDDSLNIPFKKIRGAYSIVIECESKIYIFSDNSNQNCMFYSGNYISNRVDCLKDVLETTPMWNEQAVCEYLSLGKVLFDKTLIENIHILNSEQYAVFSDEKLRICDKNIGKIYGKSNGFNPIDFFKNVAYAIREENYVNALTGGYDSRLVTTQLSKWGDIFPMICSNTLNNSEAKVSSKVSKALNRELNIIEVAKPTLDEKCLYELLELNDLTPFDFKSNYIQMYFKKVMNRNKNVLFITGDGGVLHKDWEWLQDLPFYHKKKTNLARFYDQRIEFINYNSTLGKRLLKQYNEQKRNVIEGLENYIRETNTESYDCLYYYVTGNRRLFYNLTEANVGMYAPLTEFEYVQFSYHLPRNKRFFYNEIRRLTTEANKKVARIPTNYGTTASSEFVFIIRDVFFQGIDYTKKVIRLLGRKIFNKSFFVLDPMNWKFEELRKLEYARKALMYAQEKEYIDTSFTIDTIDITILCRIIHLFYIHETMYID